MYFNEKSVVFLNGKFTNVAECAVNMYSQSLHYGNSVFEGIKAYDTSSGVNIFKGLEHYERLVYSANRLNLNLSYSAQEMTDLTYELLEKNKYTNAYVRPLVYTGADMSLKSSDEVNLYICAWEWAPYLGDNLLNVVVSSFQRPNPKSTFIDAKIAGHYVNSIQAVNEAKAMGYDEALLLDMNGNVAEGPGANVFIQKENKLFTPKKGHILPGITRQTLMNLASERGISVEEKDISVEELKDADSAFFTGTAAEVAGMKSINGKEFPLPWKDSLGKKLHEDYELLVRNEYGSEKKAV